MLMGRQMTTPSEQAVVAAVGARWPHVPVAPGWSGDNPSTGKNSAVFFTIDGHKVAAMAMPGPVPWGDLEFPANQSFVWPDAATELQTHDSHIIVTVMSDVGGVQQARLLTQAVAGVIDATPGSLGVYQGDASLVIPAPLYQDMAATLTEADPLFLWVNFLVGVNGNHVYGYTAGMDSIGQTADEWIKVIHGPSSFGLDRTVMQLHYTAN